MNKHEDENEEKALRSLMKTIDDIVENQEQSCTSEINREKNEMFLQQRKYEAKLKRILLRHIGMNIAHSKDPIKEAELINEIANNVIISSRKLEEVREARVEAEYKSINNRYEMPKDIYDF